MISWPPGVRPIYAFMATVLAACTPAMPQKATRPIAATFPDLKIEVPVSAGVCRDSGANLGLIWLWVDELTPLPHGVACEGGAGKYTIVAFQSEGDELVIKAPLAIDRAPTETDDVATMAAWPPSTSPVFTKGEGWLLMSEPPHPARQIVVNGRLTGVFYVCITGGCKMAFRYNSVAIAGMTWFTSRPPNPRTPADVLRTALIVKHALDQWSHPVG